MKLKSARAYWVKIPISHERQHSSDFGWTLLLDGALVHIETACRLSGWVDAEAQVGRMAHLR